MPKTKSPRRPIEILDRTEDEALIRACGRRAPTGIRNAALIAVMWRCGLRVGEALALFSKDVDLKEGVLRIHNGKGDKPRTVGLDSVVTPYLNRWMDKRKALGLGRKRRAPLFCTLDGGPVSQPYVRAMLRRKAAKTGLEKRCHPHGLRHTFAAEIAREGTPMNEVQATLGHASLAVTSAYLAHIQPQEIMDRMKART